MPVSSTVWPRVSVTRSVYGPGPSPEPAGYEWGAGHAAELAYLFDFTLGYRPLTATQRRLSAEMMRYWAAFARSGDPNVRGQARWPAFDAATHRTMVLSPSGNHVVTDIALEHNCGFWSRIGP